MFLLTQQSSSLRAEGRALRLFEGSVSERKATTVQLRQRFVFFFVARSQVCNAQPVRSIL